jgi:hypothetical protein
VEYGGCEGKGIWKPDQAIAAEEKVQVCQPFGERVLKAETKTTKQSIRGTHRLSSSPHLQGAGLRFAGCGASEYRWGRHVHRLCGDPWQL